MNRSQPLKEDRTHRTTRPESARGPFARMPRIRPRGLTRQATCLSILAFGLLCGFGIPGHPQAAEDADGPIVYTRSGTDGIAATLVPDPSPGSVPNSPALVAATIDGGATPFHLTSGEAGRVDLSGRLPGLADGRHQGAVETFTAAGGRKDRKQLLILVDSTPPLIERVAPEGDFFPRAAGSVRFRITDPENGSGVSVDPAACALDVRTNGAALQETLLSFEDDELCLTVFVAFPGGAAAHDAGFTLSVSLQDRAGNVGVASETFRIRGLTAPVFTIYGCDGRETYIETAMEFLVAPSLSAMALTTGADRQLDVYLHGCFGKDYAYPEAVRALMRRWEGTDRAGEAEVVTMNAFFQKAVGNRIGLTSTSGNVTIRKLDDDDPEDSRVAFRIRQDTPVPLGQPVGDLLLTVPVSCRIDPSRADFCSAYRETDLSDPADTIYHHLPEDAFVYAFETITIPIFQETAVEPYRLRVTQEDDLLTAEVGFTPIALMDTGASWFEFLGTTYWFDRRGEVCVAKGPAREGLVHWKVAAAHKIAEFLPLQGNDGSSGRIAVTEGDFLVCLDPPVIEHFRYDRAANALQAVIRDQGTPLEALALRLDVAGYRQELVFDPATGELRATLSFRPLAVSTATLQVTDLAGQTSRKNCAIYGDPEDEEAESSPADTDAAIRGPYPSPRSASTRDVDQVLGTTASGKALVQVCEESLQWGCRQDDRFVPIGSGARALKLVQVRALDAERRYPLREALSKKLPIRIEVLGTRYDAALYAPFPSGGFSSLAATNGEDTQSRLTLYILLTVQEGGRRIPIDEPCSYGLRFSYEAVKQCHVEERDILPPIIDAVYAADTGRLDAVIHDHGMPLSELKVDLSARSDPDKNDITWGAGYARNTEGGRPPFTFKDGLLASRFTPPQDQGEFFVLQLSAEDKAGNRNHVLIDVMAPRQPPRVGLEVETRQSHQVFSRNGENASGYLTAEAHDDSPVLPERTTLWLDGQVLAPFYRFTATGETGAYDPHHFKAGYVAGLEEGTHLARFRATDAAGLSAEASAAFDFDLAPYIHDFKVMPDAVQQNGGPALTAMILDLGGDLAVDGLALTIDGRAVDGAALTYDPASGYFALDGPLAIAPGRHVAAVTATDRRGNRAEATLRFSRAMDIFPLPPIEGDALAIDSVMLMELEDHNGDGRANPGERVRLFITLRNEAVHTFPCTGRLASEDPDIVVETESIRYDETGPDTLEALTGFDLRIGGDVLGKTISDPYEAYFTLRVGCGTDHETVLPLVLPIYRPSLPAASGLTITLDRLPPTTTAGTFRVEGTVASSAAFVDWMEIRVNGVLQDAVSFDREGGRYGTTVDLAEGANTIEVTGGDSAGERGWASGYLYRTFSFRPPSITIASPDHGDRFQCGDLTVTGTYGTGSGALDAITVDAPWQAGRCPVTIIDDSRFTVNCGDIVFGPRGHYDIRATIRTTDGAEAVDTLAIFVEDCS